MLENPELWFGCISDDGSDVRPMWPHGRQYTYAAVTENNEVVHVEG